MAKLSNTNTGTRKNLIINGDMKVSQRGASFTSLSNGTRLGSYGGGNAV
jgi:hypothetical protein